MKRLLAFILVIVICIFMCSCDPSQFSIDRDSLNDVISIDLIEYKNSNQKQFSTWVPDQFDKLIPFVPANATIIETLPSEKISDFLDAFTATDILHTYYAYNSPKDTPHPLQPPRKLPFPYRMQRHQKQVILWLFPK